MHASANRSLISLRSPLPLLVSGIAVALLVIVLAALAQRAPQEDPSTRETLNEREAITLVAREMRAGDAAMKVATEGRARFEDGSWFISVGDATFRFSERNRIVLAENEAALRLEFKP